MLIFLAGHQEMFSKQICLSDMKYGVKTSKMKFLSKMLLKRMSKRIF